MTQHRASTNGRPPAAHSAAGRPVAQAVLLAVAVVVLQALLVPLFAGPAANLAPRDLPIAVAGPASATTALRDRLATVEPGAFEVTTLPDGAAADRALRDREVYAAFVLGPDGVALHTASAASPTVAALLTGAAQQLGQPVTVVDVVPTDADDPRGGGFASGFLPFALTSLLVGVALALLVRGRTARLAGIATYTVLAGLVGAAVLQFWLGVIPGTYAANAAAIGLLALAISGAVAGLGAMFGRAGVGLGALLVFVVGNPLSAVSSAPELLPQPWGAVGQWLPVGAGGTLLRSTAYFGGAGAGPALAALSLWAVVGLALVLLARSAPASPEGTAKAEDIEAREAARRLGAVSTTG
jgi:hypothetical protein